MLTWLIILLFCAELVALLVERLRADRNRKSLAHVIYVNGIRGKSSVTRLIDAGLRAGGYRTFCKTTGTLPMVIDTAGKESIIRRRGCANIKEQLWTLHQAANQNAEILVAECMAVDPALQKLSQQQMLHADIGVITNVRLDHTDEMGQTLPEICDSLCGMIPENGMVFTADPRFASRIAENASKLHADCILANLDGLEQAIDFDENVALALAVCETVGVDRDTALEGMADYHRDPYALSLHRLAAGGLFIGALSVNDPQSTVQVWQTVCTRHALNENRLVLLLNNRRDRGYRTAHMLLVAKQLRPDEIWLVGAAKRAVARRLSTQQQTLVRCFARANDLPFCEVDDKTVIFAAGNIAQDGHFIMERVRKEGESLVL